MKLESMMLCGCTLLALLFPLRPAVAGDTATKTVAFNRDIRPILSENCYPCHGPDAKHREADLRLDVRDVALSAKAIVPGSPDESELVARIFSQSADEVMPPPASHKKLAPRQKELLKRWIKEGAGYQGHWSYTPPTKPSVPAGVNGVDYFVQSRLAEAGLKPSPEADRRTLIRRLYLDLVGLPPKPEQVDAFAADPDPQACRRLVEQLLASPHYGERMAVGWLDVVRFADTIGYHSDNPRNVWPYRDYVIRAFNQNKPFDEFTVEQLAGDLLPGSTQEQKVGSCFNRLLLTTEEGGAQSKDYEARMLTDRVRAVGTVWLGQTFGCCQCHDHKFDPITARDFYSMGAFFADIQEPILGRREDGMAVPDPQPSVELARLDAEIAGYQKQFAAAGREPATAQAEVRKRLEAAQKARTSLEAGLPRCLVSVSMSNPPHGPPAASRGLDERERPGGSAGPAGVLAGPKDRRAAPDAVGPGPVDQLARQPADRAGAGQPLVEAVLRDRPLPDAGRLGLARRMAWQSATAGLAGLRVHG